VRVEEIDEGDDILIDRLLYLWKNRVELGITHSSNLAAMRRDAVVLGVELPF